MALTTLANIRLIPGLNSTIILSDAWANALIDAADYALKEYAKQNIELAAYTEFYNGDDMPDVVLNQFPAWAGSTQVAAGSNGVSLPTGTINVVSTLNPDGSHAFDPGGRSTGQSPVISVQTGVTTWTTVSYTGKTATSFTGCTGGTGTMSSTAGLNAVSQPVVFVDPSARWGQAPVLSGGGPFGAQTIQVLGVTCALEIDKNNKSYCGLLKRVGGYGGGWIGQWPGMWGERGKLASSRLPTWPRGYGNIKVQYSAGFSPVPADIVQCANALVAGMVRDGKAGGTIQSESLGAYSYSLLMGSQDPEIGSVRSMLSRRRDMSW